MKKILAVLLSLAVLMSLVLLGAITASAASLTVYVGGKLLADGNYLTNSGYILSDKPTGVGYAHLSGNTLVLYNYSYAGSGMSIGGGADCTTAVYANGDLTVSLYGGNTLYMDNIADSYAIYTTGALTINEDAVDGGSLIINRCTRGINCNGSVTFAGGTTTITAKDYGIYCNSGVNITKGELTITDSVTGIYCGGAFTFTDGKVDILADNYAVFSDSTITVNGGYFDFKSEGAVSGARALYGTSITFNSDISVRASTAMDAVWVNYSDSNNANYKRVAHIIGVYVGGVPLCDDEFLAVGSSKATTTKSSGGYAYYKDGVLTLNDYTYDGAGYDIDATMFSGYTALVYSTKVQTVKLVGTNTLTNSIDSRGVGIWALGKDLTIIDGGSGALNITVKDDGIYVLQGDIDIRGGAITVTADDNGICSTSMTISGGKVTVNSGNNGIYSSSKLTISGGTIHVTAQYDGIASGSNLTISGGELDVTGDERAIDSNNIVLDGVTLHASTTKDGTLTDYVAANIDNYKRIVCLADVYVGGVGLANGQYLATGSASATTTKPSGGYAYYNNGTLTLNNYSYTGSGKSIGGGADCTSAVYAIGALTVSLYGDNTFNMNNTADSYAFYTTGALTINEDAAGGNLAISNCTRGINCDGSVVFAGGTTTITAKDYGIYCNNTFGITKGKLTITAKEQHGIYAKDALILGGNIAIIAKGGGINASGMYGQSGGIVTIDAAATGIVSISTFKQTGGELYITSDSNAVSSISDVTFSGGLFDIKSTTIRALVGKTVTFTNMAPKASTTADGSLTDYVAANIANYKRIACLADVYVGGVGLANGQYLATGSASATTTKPSGGYAYYKDGVLTLNDYTYDGAGCDVPGSADYTALVYSTKALTVKLVGTNALTNSIDFAGVGIWVHKEALTIIDGGSGALNITVRDDGIYTYDDDIDIQGGAITVTTDDYGIYSSDSLTISGGTVIVNAEEYGIVADDSLTISDGNVTVVASDNLGICGDSLTISGGKIIVNAADEGLYAEGDTVISGGNVTVNAAYGIYTYDNLTISGGTVTVDAYTKGIYACYGNLTISGGTVTVYDCNDAAVAEEKNIVVSGGTVHLYDCNYGLFTTIGSVVIEGGKITIEAECDAINSRDNALISGGELDLISTDLMSDENYSAIRCHAILLVENITLYAATDPDNAVGTFTLTKLKDYDRIISSCAKHTYDHACDKDCNRCGATRTPSAHKGGTATCKVKAKCSVCGESYGSLKAHSYEKKTTKATLTKDGIIKNVCKSCGYTASKTTTIYKASSVKLSKTSYTYNGKVQKPSVVVKDSKGNTISSSHYTVTYPSGMKNAGTYKVKITFKGNYSGTKTLTFKINPINVSKCKISLSKTSYTYNGKVQKPTVTVKNASGTKLTTSSYTVTYASGRKNVGKYKVTVKMKGNYTGTKTLYFTINPAKTTVKSLTAGSKKLTVNITKKSTQVTGYQIQYSTSKKFTSAETKTITSYKTTKATLSSLKAKTTYYVRVRTYKTVNGVKYYSGWSTYKYMKTK